MPPALLSQVQAEPEPVPSEAEAEADPRRRSYVEICIDRSGSMQSMGKIPQEQTAELFASQKRIAQENNLDIRISFTSFDDIATTFIDNTYAHVAWNFVETLPVWLKPRNTTLLIDTLLARIAVLRTRVKDYKATLPERREGYAGDLNALCPDRWSRQPVSPLL